MNSAPVSGTQYTDNSAQSGTSYYVIKSVDNDGDESPGTLEMTVTLGSGGEGSGASVAGSMGGSSGGGCFISSML